jgi:peptidoglycan/LPS O-acetylase OafA/YrhL
MDKTSMEIKYPWPIRVGVVVVCLVLLAAMYRELVRPSTMVVTIGAIALAIYLLAFRIVVNRREVRVRQAPFLTSSTQLQDVTHLVEDGTVLVLVTPDSRIPLRGLSIGGRETLFNLLPPHLNILVSRTARRGGDGGAAVRRHKRWTLFAGIGFLATAGLVVPFFKGGPLHRWNVAGDYLLLVCLCFSLPQSLRPRSLGCCSQAEGILIGWNRATCAGSGNILGAQETSPTVMPYDGVNRLSTFKENGTVLQGYTNSEDDD